MLINIFIIVYTYDYGKIGLFYILSMSEVIIISSSNRKNSNSDIMAEVFYNGVLKSGLSVEKINLKGKNIGYCTGCLYCHKNNVCIIKDDAVAICEKIKMAKYIVFATPTYFYQMSGQLKVLLDRTNPLYTDSFINKKVILLISAAEDEDWVADFVKVGFEGWIKCFKNIFYDRTFFIGGVNKPREALNNEKLKEIYDYAKALI